MIITRTPFRISFFGGGTDYPGWYREHGGAVLATSIDKYVRELEGIPGVSVKEWPFDHFADKGGVHILRSMPDGTKAKLPCSVKDVEKGRRPDIVLQANDIVVVPEKWFSW